MVDIVAWRCVIGRFVQKVTSRVRRRDVTTKMSFVVSKFYYIVFVVSICKIF